MDEISIGLEKLWRKKISDEMYSDWTKKLEQRDYKVHPFGLIAERGKDCPIADIRVSEKCTDFGNVRIVLAREIKENQTQLLHLRYALNMENIPYRESGLVNQPSQGSL